MKGGSGGSGDGFPDKGPNRDKMGFCRSVNLTTHCKAIIMNPLIGSRLEHQGQTLIVGHGGRLYAPRTSVDAWGRTRPTQKVTKYRIVACACGHSFIAHDGRMKTCEACQAHAQQLRRTRRTAEVKSPAASGGALKATQTDSTVNPQLFRCDDVECSGG